MAERPSVSRRVRLMGLFLVLCGEIGLITGIVPAVVNGMRLLGWGPVHSPDDIAAHGVEAIGLSIPWAMLSSSDGAFLGGLLVAAGIGWRRGRPWAPLVSFIYGVGGTMVTGVDLLIFATRAKPGPVRTAMLTLDGLACALAVTVLVGTSLWWLRRRRRAG